MKRLLILFTFILSFAYSYSSEIDSVYQSDSLDIKKWAKEDFIKEFGTADSTIALINLFFKKSTRGKTQTILGSAFLIGGVTALAIQGEPGDDQAGFGDIIEPVAEPGAAILGAMFTTSGIIKLGKYTKQKLYILLSNYKNEIPIPEKYRRKLKRKYFAYRISSNPKF